MADLRKIKAGLVKIDIEQFVGEAGNLFFNTETGDLRLSDGITPGGISLGGPGGYVLPTASATVLGGIKVGAELSINSITGVLSADLSAVNQDIIPAIDAEYSLGTPEKRWKEVRVSTGSVYIGDLKLSNSGGALLLGDTLSVDGDPQTVFRAVRDVDDYVSLSIRNLSNGPKASSDILLYQAGGTDDHYADFGIANDGYAYAGFEIIQPDDVYLLAHGGNIKIGTGFAGTDIVFFTGGTDSTSHEIARFVDKQGLVLSGSITFPDGSIQTSAAGSAGDGYTGSKGDIGYVGSQGIIGFTGSQGYAGSKGDIGYVGSKGDIGYVGSSGYAGSKGDIGYVGSQGIIGFTGSAGVVGSIGDIGYVGSKGDIGYVGSSGYAGSKGDIGYVGSQGIIGFTGSAGVVGSIGDIGYVGSKGDIGFTGSSGYVGSKGDIGYVGSKGDQGDQGVSLILLGSVETQIELPSSGNTQGDAYINQADGDLYVWNGTSWNNVGQIVGPVGSKGDIGFTGSSGYAGSKGDIGYVGSKGDIGYVGSSGYAGSKGDIGYVGSKGDIGYAGSSGYAGSKGDIGYVGSKGDIGYTGSDGYAGSKGDIGYVGSQGIIGFTGSSGYAGSKGDIGYVGSQGIIGFTGSSGYAGSKGDSGYTGSQGYTGSIGYTGSAATGLVSNSVNIVELSAGYDFVPATTNLQNLGSDTNRFKDLFLSGTTIDIGGTTIFIDSENELSIKNANGDYQSLKINNLLLGAGGNVVYSDGSVQVTKAPRMYTNADAAAGLTIEDLMPGDFYYDDGTESIFIMVDTGLGYNNLLDLTVRAAQ